MEKQTKIIYFKKASEEELASIVYQILMDNKGRVLEINMKPDNISYTVVKVEE